MKRLFLAVALIGSLTATAQTSWAPAGDRIKTRWAEDLDPAAPLPEYPRPMLVREKWMNLNGLWNYSLTTAGAARPNGMQGQILVPFPIESSLSGVQRRVSEKEALWYETTFEVPAAWRKGNKLLLHFGAVDWKTEVYVNDLMVGSHTGGYTPFAFDITPTLTAKGAQKLTVKVTDPTDKGYQPRGKQVTKPSGIWYTPVTGIWQTVWLEPVPAENHIERIAATSDIHDSVLNVEVKTSSTAGDRVRVQLSAEGAVVAEGCSLAGQPVRLTVPDARLWSPDDPYLYDLAVTLERDGKTIDRATSYAALREIGRERDAFGIERLVLCGITGTPPSREIHKSALGAEMTVAWEYERESTKAVQRLRESGYTLLAVEQVHGAIQLDRLDLTTFALDTKFALVFGNEVEGVSQQVVDLCHGAIEIPQVGTKHSLNVSVSGGVVLWEFFRQMR